MKNIFYYIFLLILIALITGFLLSSGQSSSMSMSEMVTISAVLILYTIALSFVGEGKTLDERQILHRNLSNRAGLAAGIVVFSVGIIYQLFTHRLDYWLLAGLIIINLTKIINLIYLENKN